MSFYSDLPSTDVLENDARSSFTLFYVTSSLSLDDPIFSLTAFYAFCCKSKQLIVKEEKNQFANAFSSFLFSFSVSHFCISLFLLNFTFFCFVIILSLSLNLGEAGV